MDAYVATIASRRFSEAPGSLYICPTCKTGQLVPDQESFVYGEPKFSKDAHDHEAWDPDWITFRFRFRCICSSGTCGEVTYAIGLGGVDERYDRHGEVEYYNLFTIKSFYPAPYLVRLPEGVPSEVVELIERSFALYWIDTSSASNALRASLEVLLDELGLPRMQLDKNGDERRLSLHRRIEIWSEQRGEEPELFLALKDVGNLGSHGEHVEVAHYHGVLQIYSHVLFQLYEQDAARMKALAKEIRAAIKNSAH